MILFYRRNLPLWIYLKKIEYIPEKHRTEKTIAGSVDRHRTIIQVGSYKYGIWLIRPGVKREILKIVQLLLAGKVRSVHLPLLQFRRESTPKQYRITLRSKNSVQRIEHLSFVRGFYLPKIDAVKRMKRLLGRAFVQVVERCIFVRIAGPGNKNRIVDPIRTAYECIFIRSLSIESKSLQGIARSEIVQAQQKLGVFILPQHDPIGENQKTSGPSKRPRKPSLSLQFIDRSIGKQIRRTFRPRRTSPKKHPHATQQEDERNPSGTHIFTHILFQEELPTLH